MFIFPEPIREAGAVGLVSVHLGQPQETGSAIQGQDAGEDTAAAARRLHPLVLAQNGERHGCEQRPDPASVAEADLKPHRLDRYMASSDLKFEEKAAEVIGLYLNPPQHAAVFCVDEKSAIQALDRLDRRLPLSPGRAERHGFEYHRHGTLSLYAALNPQTGEVIGQMPPRHTSAEFVAFLVEVMGSQPENKRFTLFWTTSASQNTSGKQFPGGAQKRDAAFHANLFFLVEPVGNLVFQTGARRNRTRDLHFSVRSEAQDYAVYTALWQNREAFSLEVR